ncbi:MAG: hypothetical protein HRU50_12705 [Winogradskyella sp.]|uniref:hypothetical protein n=1 Tax=Winogradskyella sp. TaxID=1883156 RepID=UPI002600073D|nr:hypothetical protein [Winogradskyella sp.]NRB60783.1 hypothetical protein [Winogradskyella sp.]
MKILKKGVYYILALLLLTVSFSCEEDDDFRIIEGLDFVVATLNVEGTETGVLPSTAIPDGRIVYTVDFGDPNSDADVFQTSGPMVTYEYPLETATYMITVTAVLPGRDDVSISKEHTVIFVEETDPDPVPATGIVGTWRLAPEAGALGVGPGQGDVSWWSNSSDDVATRDCLFDDEYVIGADGSFQNVMGDQTWLEPWQGTDPEACGTPVFPHDGSSSGTYTFGGGELTIDGQGSFMGLAKVVNGLELGAADTVPDSRTYQAILSDNDTVLTLQIQVAGDGWWSFKFVKDAPAAPAPIEGTWKLAPEAGALAVGPGQGDASWWSNSSDDVATRACLFDDEYVFNSDGSFQNVLGAQTWVEPWQGAAAEECGSPVFPHDGTASATYDYNASAGTLTIDGAGAFLGLAKVVNGAEIASPAEAASSITYIADLSDDGNTLILDIQVAGDGWWRFKMAKQVPPSNPLVGTWKLAPEAGALGVGPGLNDVSWWSNSSDDVATRACLFDDDYVFNSDGSFQNVLGADTWLEPWQGAAAEECGSPVFPHDGTASATYDYNEGAGTITIDGTGAFLGLAKVVNGAELTSPGSAPSSITYIANLVDSNTLELDIEIADGGYWSFKLVKQ